MTTRSAILARGTLAPAAQTVVATVPAGQVWIVKSLNIHNLGSVAGETYTVYMVSADGTVTVIMLSGSLSALGFGGSASLWYVMTGGDTIQLITNNNSVSYWFSGAALFV